MKCIKCNVNMKKVFVKYKGMQFEARQCPNCKEKIFTEKQAMKAISKLEAERLKKEYIKKPIQIGHSWGMTFPKEVTEAFDLKTKKLKIRPDIEKNLIEISFC